MAKASSLETSLHKGLLEEGFKVVGQTSNDTLPGFLKTSMGFHNFNPERDEYAVLPIKMISDEEIKEYLPGLRDHDSSSLGYFVYLRRKV